jgi:hypothetical protein
MTKSDKIRQAEAEEQAALVVLTTLSVEQQNAIDLLVTGQTDTEVATTVGVTRQTISIWRNHHPGFQAALHARRQAIWGAAVDRLRELLPKAVERLEAELDGPDGWKIALRLIEATGLVRPQGAHLGAYGVGATEPEGIIDGIARARHDADVRRPLGIDYTRRTLAVELAERLTNGQAGGE